MTPCGKQATSSQRIRCVSRLLPVGTGAVYVLQHRRRTASVPNSDNNSTWTERDWTIIIKSGFYLIA